MKKLVFISGLHRSGTSVLHEIIGSSDQVSKFSNTAVPEDEGQHLQSVYRAAKDFGGAGKFAFNAGARLDESSPLISPENKEKMLSEWRNYWDEGKPVWLEKSPPNIIRMRFLQKLFPEAYFVTIIRHPIAVAMATQKWSKTTLDELIRHWIAAHEIHQTDRTKIRNEIFFSYEQMVQSPHKIIQALESFLDIRIPYEDDFVNHNEKYLQNWTQAAAWQWLKKRERKNCEKKYEALVNAFGYSLIDFDKFPALEQE